MHPHLYKSILLAFFIVPTALLIGCGTPGAPMPPSLDLPVPIDNLSATRNGNLLTLTWTQPRRNTDHLLLKGDVDALICLHHPAGECSPINQVYVRPGADERTEIALPKELTEGPARPVQIAVQSRNSLKRAAGFSNLATILAGAAPAPVASFSLSEDPQGVVFHWRPEPNETLRITRHRIAPPEEKSATAPEKNSPLAAPEEPEYQTFLIPLGASGHAVDRTARVKTQYEYSAERLIQQSSGNQTLELKSAPSPVARIYTRDIFAPLAPQSLVAVATNDGSNPDPTLAKPVIDLSWQPSLESGLIPPTAGYILYRREGSGDWQRISPIELIPGLSFRDTRVFSTHSYEYAVAAVGINTRESKHSDPASESIP